MESLDETENDNYMITDYKEEDIDDSWVRPEDKKQLLITIKKIYEKKFEWADDVLLKCLIKHHYKEVIKNMNKKDYLEEIKRTDVDTLLEQL